MAVKKEDIVMLIVSICGLFNFDISQQRQLEDWASIRQTEWVENCKRKEEIESMLKSQAEIIAGK